MEKLVAFLLEILAKTLMAVLTSLAHNWLPLSLAIITAAVMRAHVDAEKLKEALTRKTKISIWASVAVGAFTPLCACGTMALVIGMLTTTLPWGPVMAFLTSSPLMSPDGFILIAGIFDLKFAVALTIASVGIGLGSGYLTHLIEQKTSFLRNQTRFGGTAPAQTCGCKAEVSGLAMQSCGSGDPAPGRAVEGCGDCGAVPILAAGGCCAAAVDRASSIKMGAYALAGLWRRLKVREIAEGLMNLGLKQILPNFALFVAIGFLVNCFMPASLIMGLFGGKNIFAVPSAALIGLPLYVTTESAVPLIKSFFTSGAGGGAILAFMITGPATSAWVIAGISMFMKKRVIGLYVLFILLGGIFSGYLYELILAMGI